MLLRGVDTLAGQAVDQPFGRPSASREVLAQFRALLDQMEKGQLAPRRPDADVPAPPVAPVPSEPPAVATQPVPPAQVASRDRLGATASSLLVDPTLSALELLPADLTAGDARYNTREVMLRERLSLPAVESRLREAARQTGVEFDRSDLEGVLRNAGYDAAHLGSTERYMAAIEKFVGEAENSYRQRTGNMPGSRA